jgi:hypothetical protein
MKISLRILLAMLLLVPTLGLAQTAGDACSGDTGTFLCNALPEIAGIKIGSIAELFEAVFTWLATVIGTLALVMVIYSGARMIFSQGDVNAVGQAKQSMTYAIGGLVVVIFAYAIIAAVEYGLKGVGDLDPDDAPNTGFINPLKDENLLYFVQSTTQYFLAIIGAATMLYIIFAAFRYVTSAGNEEQAKKARAGLTWAVFGLISIIFSYVIITAVINTIT